MPAIGRTTPLLVRRRIIDGLNHNSVVRYVKNARNEIVDRSFRARGQDEARCLIDVLRRVPSRDFCFTIAFNVPWTVELLICAWQRFQTGLTLVVANNSSNLRKRQDIEAVCKHYGIPHVHLPSNPEWNPCRSHAIAMNWLYFNVVRRLRPNIFGFIDHDCFPVLPYDVPARLRGGDMYGLRRVSAVIDGAWYFWAGFCFYRFASVEALPVDFKHRVEFGLDTGGGNWTGIYKIAVPQKVVCASYEPLDQSTGLHIIIDDAFVHVGGASFRRGSMQTVADKIWRTYLGGITTRMLPVA